MININGCVYCGILERDHGSRYDRLHPPGVTTYTAPTNYLRKVRLLLRRGELDRLTRGN